MFCNQCGMEITDEGTRFCPNCGSRLNRPVDFENIKNTASEKLQEGVSAIQEQTETYQAQRREELEREKIAEAGDVFIDSAERQQAVLGAGYLNNFIHGAGLGRGFGIVSDRRFYFRGTCLYRAGSQYIRTNEERAVDLEDVTSSGFVYYSNIRLLVLAVLGSVISFLLLSVISYGGGFAGAFLLALCVTAALWALYFLSRQCIYEVSFAGGSIAVRASHYGIEETKAFDRTLRRAKDLAVRRR